MQKQVEKEKTKQKKMQSNGKSSGNAPNDKTITGEARRGMIAEAAYYRAEKRGFQNGDPISDWLAAEEEVDEQLSEPVGPAPSAIVLELESRW